MYVCVSIYDSAFAIEKYIFDFICSKSFSDFPLKLFIPLCVCFWTLWLMGDKELFELKWNEWMNLGGCWDTQIY